MNPFDLSASDLLIWGVVLHLTADWALQNDWMSNGKAAKWWRRDGPLAGPQSILSVWKVMAPGLVHASIHLVALGIVFGYWPALALAVAHYLIDLRTPVAWWSRLVRQAQPSGEMTQAGMPGDVPRTVLLYDIGIEVRLWTDQVFHIACIAVAALVVA